jgi:hypothetical protein
MLCHELFSNKWMRCSIIKKNCCRYRIDKERTKHNIFGLLGFFSCHMVHPTMHVVLLACVTFLRCLLIALRENTSIVSQVSAIETSTGVNWSIIPHWCAWAVLMRSLWCHWVGFFGFFKRMTKLLILSIVSALYARTKLRVLWWVVTWASVAARLSLILKLALLFTKFLAFILQACGLIE